MASPFSKKKLPGPVKSEFDARSNGAKLLKWTAQRFPWIHVMTMSDACGGDFKILGTGPNTQPALLGTASSKAGLRSGAPGKYLPLTTIKSLDVKALGSLGTTRKATLSFDCFTDEELVELQKCYFIPGMDVRVQWGWNESCSGQSKEPIMDILKRSEADCMINARRRSGNSYDGFQGIVGNFKYSLSNENVWECSIEIISAADPFTNSNVTSQDCDCARKSTMEDEEGEEKEVVEKNSPLYSTFFDSFKSHGALSEYASKLRDSCPDHEIRYGTIQYLGKARTETGADDSSWYEGTFFNDYDTTEPYVTWGYFEAAMNRYCLPDGTDVGSFPAGSVRSIDTYLTKPKKCFSGDPRVAVIPGGDYEEDLLEERVSGNFRSCVEGSEVRLSGILLNCQFLLTQVKSVVDGDGKLKTLIENVFKEVNRVCGNPWSLEVMSSGGTEEECKKSGKKGKAGAKGPKITLVDLSVQPPGYNDTYLIPAKADSSALRSFKFDLKMTGAMKTQALYSSGKQQKGSGNTSNGGEPTGCEASSLRGFNMAGQGSIKNLAVVPPAEPKCDCESISSADTPDAPPSMRALVDEAGDYICDETTNSLISKLVEEIHGEGEDSDRCKGIALPFDFGLEVDGLGGIEFGHTISCDRIPAEIRKNWEFQVTKVEHKVSINDWSTSVSTIARPKD